MQTPEIVNDNFGTQFAQALNVGFRTRDVVLQAASDIFSDVKATSIVAIGYAQEENSVQMQSGLGRAIIGIAVGAIIYEIDCQLNH